MKKLITLSLLVCVTAALFPTLAFAQSGGEPVVIIPYLDHPDTVYSNQEIILGARWGACSRGLTQQIDTSAHLDWTLNGIDLFKSHKEVRQYWETPVSRDIGSSPCIAGDKEHIWLAFWYYSLGKLEAGDYDIGLHYWLARPTIDGGDYDGDGHPDHFIGTLVDTTITIHVVDPD